MPLQPFNETTWKLRSTLNLMPLNGVYSGIVSSLGGGYYDRASGVVQVFANNAHHFNGLTNTAQASADHGKTWTPTFNEGSLLFNKVAIAGFSLPHPKGVGRIHFQMRYDWEKAFLIADGTIQAGGMDLYVSENGTQYNFLQRMHSWPHTNQIGGNGGAAVFNTFPSFAAPILLEGTGPEGEDAYWMITGYSFDAGGAGNRTTFKAAMLWRSVDGIEWEEMRDLEPSIGIESFGQIFLSAKTGRLFISTTNGLVFTDGASNLVTASFTPSNVPGSGGLGRILPMFGGTLLTIRSGTLISGGQAHVSCDDGATWNTLATVVPVNQTGYVAKLGASEALVVAPGFSDPSTQTVAEYSADGGETWLTSAPWLVSTSGESPCMLELLAGSHPIVVTRSGRCFTSSDAPLGVAQARTICPLANAGLLPAIAPRLCGAPVAVNQCD